MEREILSKYFFDMSKATYTIMVLGGLASFFGIVDATSESTGCAILFGTILAVLWWIIGYVILKK